MKEFRVEDLALDFVTMLIIAINKHTNENDGRLPTRFCADGRIIARLFHETHPKDMQCHDGYAAFHGVPVFQVRGAPPYLITCGNTLEYL
jgi:hypothetical protein